MGDLSAVELRNLIAIANSSDDPRSDYYASLANSGVAYGILAGGVVREDTLSGRMANAFLANYAANNGINISSEQALNISRDLMRADLVERVRSSGRELGYDVIQAYHSDVFERHGLSIEAWTATAVLNTFGRQAAEMGLSPDAAKQFAWEMMMQSDYRGAGAVSNIGTTLFMSVFAAPLLMSGRPNPLFDPEAARWMSQVGGLAITGAPYVFDEAIPDWLVAPNSPLFEAISNQNCFLAGTQITLADGSTKPIEQIRPNDMVMSFDPKTGKKTAGRVTRTFRNEAKIILDFHGTFVTPGHVYFRPDSARPSKFEPLIDILRDDGMIQDKDGRLIRAATGCDVGSVWDVQVKMAPTINGKPATDHARLLRLGTRFYFMDGQEATVREGLENVVGPIDDKGLMRDGRHVTEVGFIWPFESRLPNPEDYVLIRSGTTLADIYRAGEWEGVRPIMPAPMTLDGGPMQPLAGHASDQTPRNRPLSMAGLGPGGSPLEQRKAGGSNSPVLNRKQRKAMEAAKKNLQRRARILH